MRYERDSAISRHGGAHTRIGGSCTKCAALSDEGFRATSAAPQPSHGDSDGSTLAAQTVTPTCSHRPLVGRRNRPPLPPPTGRLFDVERGKKFLGKSHWQRHRQRHPTLVLVNAL